MAKTLEEYMAKRPGRPEVQARHMERMLAEVRAYRLRELREMMAMTQTHVAETLAMKGALGEHAYKVAVSSTKSMTGHLLGAAGGIEAIFSLLALRDQVIPPTINLDNPDEGCDLDYVPKVAREAKLEIALSNSFGFGGTNGTLAFKRFV